MRPGQRRPPLAPPIPAAALSPRAARLMEKVQLIQAQNALLRSRDENSRLNFINGMSQLVQAAQYRQTDITSIQPLIVNNQYAQITLQYNMLIFMYSTHGLIQTAIDQPVLDAFKDRIGLSCKTLSPRNLDELDQWWEENGIEEPKTETVIWGRLFGGSAAIINVAGDPRKPLDLKEVERGRFALYPATRWELGGAWRYSDTYNFYGMDFDKSRVLTFIGKRMPWILERQLAGWGASLIARMAEDFNVYLRTRNALYETINEFKIDVYKMKGYTDQLLTSEGTQQVDARIAMTNSLKNFHQALILDAEDEYEIKQSSFTGIADVMRENRMGMVAATRMPVEKLFGEQQKGTLGGGGQDAMENYNEGVVEAEVRKPCRPLIKRLLSLGAAALFGGKHNVDFEYPPLRSMDAKTEEEVKTSVQARITSALESGLIDEAEAAAWAHREKLIPFTTNLAKRGLRKTGEDVKDLKSRKSQETQGAEHEKRKGSGVGGDARQVPRAA